MEAKGNQSRVISIIEHIRSSYLSGINSELEKDILLDHIKDLYKDIKSQNITIITDSSLIESNTSTIYGQKELYTDLFVESEVMTTKVVSENDEIDFEPIIKVSDTNNEVENAIFNIDDDIKPTLIDDNINSTNSNENTIETVVNENEEPFLNNNEYFQNDTDLLNAKVEDQIEFGSDKVRFDVEGFVNHYNKDISKALKLKPLTNLKDAIGLNDKFRFVKFLYGNNFDLFTSEVETINQFGSLLDFEYYFAENGIKKLTMGYSEPILAEWLEYVFRRFC